MKKTLFLILFAVFQFTAFAQTESSQYDSLLAKSLGADDYGMKSYVLAILKTGPKVIDNKTIRDSLFRGHMENIGRLAEMGKLIVAGPFGKNEKGFRGIFILNVKSVDEAKELTNTDPAIKAGIFEVDLLPWYGSAALPVYLETHKKIEKDRP
jgi:uncharacterized protein YciI